MGDGPRGGGACASNRIKPTRHPPLKAVGNVSRALTQQGIAVLRFDFTGLGESEGDFAETNFSSNVEDLVEMAGLLERERQAPRILIGHSLGGAAAIRAAARIASVRAVATIGAPHDPRHVAHLFGASLAAIEQTGEARVTLAGRPFTIRRQLLDDLAAASLDGALGSLGRALLVFHSPVDRVVGIENAARIFQAARHPKSFVSLDRADHLLSDEADSLYVGSVLGAWARKYLDAPREERGPAPAEPAVVACLESADVFRTEILAGGHPLLADEPIWPTASSPCPAASGPSRSSSRSPPGASSASTASPSASWNVAGYYDPLVGLLDHAVAEGFVSPANRGLLSVDGDAVCLIDRIAAHEPPPAPSWITPQEA